METNRCSLTEIIEIIGKKWRIPVIWHLNLNGNMRYNELKRALAGITNIMLTRTLKDLENHDLIIRKKFSEVPPHVEYSLTEKCLKIVPALELINKWGKEELL